MNTVSLEKVANETAQPAFVPILWQRINRLDLARTALLALCSIAIGFGITGPFPFFPLIALVGLTLGCWPIVAQAWQDTRNRQMSMELSMLIAIAAAAAIGEWFTALIITTFVLAAEILEDLSMDRGRDALSELMSFLPSVVRVREGSQITAVVLEQVQPGWTVVISPGERVPVDGTVLTGSSTLDQSRLTGESLPVDVSSGDFVYAGSINHLGALEVRAERVGAESSYGHIIQAVRQAQTQAVPVQRLADRLASYLIVFAITAAVITFLITQDWTSTISVVVVAGACGIAAGTPLAVLAAIARVARNGAFVKGGAHLEVLSRVNVVVFDKTGTLTEGVLVVTGVRPSPGIGTDTVLAAAASAEMYSEHPLGQAIVTAAKRRELTIEVPENFAYKPGLGITADIGGREIRVGSRALVPEAPAENQKTLANVVYVATQDQYLGCILLADTVRDSAEESVAKLNKIGLRVLMLTGDREETAQNIAQKLGIVDVHAGLLPEEKLAIIDAERAAGNRLLMVGDGVNDAPALARADVGIAMGSGTEIARESAGIVLISTKLDDLIRTILITRRARAIIMANFVGTIVIDLIGMALAAAGLLDPVVAAFIHVGSETAFILNSARLIPARRKRT